MFDLITAYHSHVLSLSAVSFLTCLLIIELAPRFPRLTGSNNINAVQSAHKRPTARVGGLGIFIALFLGLFLTPQGFSTTYLLIFIATSVIFIVGLFEDLGWHMSPKQRLLSAIIANIVAILCFATYLTRANLIGLDAVMPLPFIGIPITIFVSVGIVNGFNLIDGLNGLSSTVAMTTALSLGAIAYQAGQTDLALITLMLAAAIVGFWVLNFPFGFIFLGDAGAYSLGFILSWIGILLIQNTSDITTWAILLTFFWPVADASLAIYRRSKRKMDKMQPDRMHAHQITMRGLEILFLGRAKRHISNPLSTVILTPFIICPALLGILFATHTVAAFLSLLGFSILFLLTYGYALKRIHHA